MLKYKIRVIHLEYFVYSVYFKPLSKECKFNTDLVQNKVFGDQNVTSLASLKLKNR
jgi:hypothetical protein